MAPYRIALLALAFLLQIQTVLSQRFLPMITAAPLFAPDFQAIQTTRGMTTSLEEIDSLVTDLQKSCTNIRESASEQLLPA